VNTQSRIAALLVSATLTAFAVPALAGQAVVTGAAPAAGFHLASAETGYAPQIVVTDTDRHRRLSSPRHGARSCVRASKLEREGILTWCGA